MLLLRSGKVPLETDEECAIFNPAKKLHSERGKRQLQLPESIYGAAIMVVLNRPINGTSRAWIPVYFSLLVNTTIQVTFALYLNWAVMKGGGDLADDTCECTEYPLRMLALGAFITFIVNDFAESFKMHRWLWLFGRAKEHEELKMRNFRYSVVDGAVDRDRYSSVETAVNRTLEARLGRQQHIIDLSHALSRAALDASFSPDAAVTATAVCGNAIAAGRTPREAGDAVEAAGTAAQAQITEGNSPEAADAAGAAAAAAVLAGKKFPEAVAAADEVGKKVEEALKQGRTSFSAPSSTHSTTTTQRLCRPESGITKWELALFYGVVLIPKLGIAGLVAWSGSGAVLRSGNNFDLVLNALAATFVLELDGWVYTMLIPISLRNLCEHTDPINMHDDEAVPLVVCGWKLFTFPPCLYRFCELGWPFIMVGMVVGLSFLSTVGWCPHHDDNAASSLTTTPIDRCDA